MSTTESDPPPGTSDTGPSMLAQYLFSATYRIIAEDSGIERSLWKECPEGNSG